MDLHLSQISLKSISPHPHLLPKLSGDQNSHGFRCFGMILGDNAVTPVADSEFSDGNHVSEVSGSQAPRLRKISAAAEASCAQLDRSQRYENENIGLQKTLLSSLKTIII